MKRFVDAKVDVAGRQGRRVVDMRGQSRSIRTQSLSIGGVSSFKPTSYDKDAITVTLESGSFYSSGVELTISDPDGIESGWVFDLSGVSPTAHKIQLYIQYDASAATAQWRAAGAIPANTDTVEYWGVCELTLDDTDTTISTRPKQRQCGDIHSTFFS